MLSNKSNKGLLLLLLGAFFMALSSGLYAQEGSDAYFKPYAGLGLSSSQISGDQLAGFNQIGFTAGTGMRIGYNEVWTPHLEILFTQKGSRKNARPDEGDYESYLLRLNYVELPIFMDFVTGKTGFHFGVSPAYLIGIREENQNGEIQGLGREFKAFDLEGLIGIQYRFHPRWELVTRYNQSVIPVRAHQLNSTFRLNQGQYNSSVQFMLRFNV